MFEGGDQPATSVIENPNPSVGYHQKTAVPLALSDPNEADALRAMLSRPLLLTAVAFPLNLATSPAVTTNILASYLSSPAIQSRLAYLRHIRATICVRIEMPVNPHMYGEAHCCIMPQPPTHTGASFGLARYYQQPVSGVFNANTGNPVVLKYPYLWYHPKLALGTSNPDLPFYCQLVVCPLSPLGRDDAVAVGTPSLNVYMWLEDVELYDTTPYTTYGPKRAPKGGQQGPSAESYQWAAAGAAQLSAVRAGGDAPPLESKPGPIAAGAAKLAGYLRAYVPFLPEAQLAAQAADSVGALAAHFGWSRPMQENKAVLTLGRRAPYLAQGIGASSATPLTSNPDAQRAVNPGVGSEAEDVMAFEWWLRRWGFLGSVSYATTTSIGTVLAAIPVTPWMVDASDVTLVPCAMVALAAERWVGSMEYRFTIAATPYHRGKLMLAYIPSTTTASTLTITQLMTTTHNVIFDVSQSTDVAVTVGWTQNQNCAVLAFTGGSALGADVLDGNVPNQGAEPSQMAVNGMYLPTTDLAETNGQLLLIAFDTLSATAAGSLTVNVWVRGGPDLQFGGSAGSLSCGAVTFGPTPDAPAADFQQAAAQTPEEVRGYWLGGNPVAKDHIARLWGDNLVSFRPLLRRYAPAWTTVPWDVATTLPALTGNGLFLKWNVPAYAPTTRQTISSNPLGMQSGTNACLTTFHASLMSLLQSAFIGVGGGVNHLVIPEGYADFYGSGITMWASAADTLPEAVPTVGGKVWYSVGRFRDNVPMLNSPYNRFSLGTEMGAVMSPSAPGLLTPLEVAVKHPVSEAYVSPSTATANVPGPFGYELNLDIPGTTFTGGNIRGAAFTFALAAGEDYQLFGFVGAPGIAQPGGQTTHNGYTAM